jgi:di/tricarboxylate transporter
MNLGIISLIALLLAIVIGFIRNGNVGILSMAFAMILSIIFKISTKDIISGFSSSLCIQMVGITYLFAIINGNGTLSNLANRAMSLVGKKTYLIPFVMFVIGYILCATGPGAIPSLAIIPVLAVPVAKSAGINPILLGLIGQMGVQSGRMSPLTPESIVVKELMEKQGIYASTVTIGWCILITELVLLAVVFIYYKGWKIDKTKITSENIKVKFNTHQKLSIVGLLVLMGGVLFFSWNVGLAGFLIGSILIVLGSGKENESIKAIPWNVILMVMGVGILMNIVIKSGGINIMVMGLEKIMTKRTASTIMSIAAGIMSFFSSGLGVVFPTLIPTSGGLASSLGANPVELCAAVIIGGTVTGYSPISTTGALLMAAVSQNKTIEEKNSQNKMFVELFGVAFAALIILAVLMFSGLFGLICR